MLKCGESGSQNADIGIAATPARSGSSAHAAPQSQFRRDIFDGAVDALELDITPHNLRDTAASLAIQAGASVVAVARLLGHDSAATTPNHYAGLFPSDLDDVANRLDAAARKAIEHGRATAADQTTPETKTTTRHHRIPTKHRPHTDQRGARGSRAMARKQR